jgi:hypothetical protein
MNLVSFEYVACQGKKHGVLVLSEFAGAATFMRDGSIPFHPANTTEMSEAIFAALNLDDEDRYKKFQFLWNFVSTNTRYVFCETVGVLGQLLIKAVQNGGLPLSRSSRADVLVRTIRVKPVDRLHAGLRPVGCMQTVNQPKFFQFH